jgi:predicted homoserine dehydrogenase-like protein
MSKSIKVALAGAGAFGLRHLDGIQLIDGVEVKPNASVEQVLPCYRTLDQLEKQLA